MQHNNNNSDNADRQIRVPHALFDATSTVLPDATQTLLLRSCVLWDERGRDALRSWLSSHDDAQGALTNPLTRWLLPLVHEAARRHEVRMDATLRTVLKTAALREDLRSRAFARICGAVARGVSELDPETVLLKGAALAETVYPEAKLRHAHDVELLVRSADLLGVAEALGKLRLSTTNEAERVVSLEHDSGLPVVLRRELFEVPFYNAIVRGACSRAEQVSVSGAHVRVLSAADALLHCCGSALHSAARGSHRWIVDSWFIVDRGRDLDWEQLVRTANQGRLTVPLSVLLTYLARELDARVPHAALAALARQATAANPIDGELALFAARSTGSEGFRTLLRRERSPVGRLRILKWMFLPSKSYLVWLTGKSDSRVAAQYLVRPVRYVFRRILPVLVKRT
jgi:hypothetical protein